MSAETPMHSHSSKGLTTRHSQGISPSASLRAVDVGLIGALFAVPFLMGGRQPLGQFVLAISAAWASIAWAIHLSLRPETKWHWSRAEPLLLAGVGLGLLHIIALPVELVNILSPRIAEILPIWNTSSETGVALGHWSYVSLTPAASRSGLVIFLCYALLFVVTTQRLRCVEDVERLLRWVSMAVAAMAAFGLIQFLTSNGKFFWVYEHPFTNTNQAPKGSFTNRNHFAQFLALGIGPLIWWVLRLVDPRRIKNQSNSGQLGQRTSRQELTVVAVGMALGLVVFTGLLSLSRGGTVAMLAAGLTCVTVLYRSRLVSGKLLAGLTGSGLLLMAFLFIYGYDAITNRLDDWESPKRGIIWQANLEMVSDFPLLGTGIGSHVETHPMYLEPVIGNKEFTHAENGYLQIASETGLIGISLALLGLGMCFWWCLSGIRFSSNKGITAAFAAIIAALAANVLHSAIDFVWYVPGCMVVVVLLAASACRLNQMVRDSQTDSNKPIPASGGRAGTRDHSKSPLRWVSVASIGGLCYLSVWMLQTQWPAVAAESHWQDYLSLAATSQGESIDDSSRELLRRKTMALAAAAKANPNDARIQLRTAKAYRSFFNHMQQISPNPMSLAQIRDAALNAGFESTAAQNKWLEKALGKNLKLLEQALMHARRAVELCPLQGAGYVYLSELEFLEHPGQKTQQTYISQAQIVRPFDAQILFAAGREAWLSEDLDLAFENWKQAFRRDILYRQQIIALLAPYISAESFLETFKPDTEALGLYKDRLLALNRTEDYRLVLNRYAGELVNRAKTTQNRDAVYNWLAARKAYDDSGDLASAEKCLLSALKIEPNSYKVRFAVGNWYFRQQRYTEAAEHLAWCLRQKPHDPTLRKMTELASDQRLRL